MNKHNSADYKRQESEVQSIRCWQFLRELWGELNQLIDRRLVKTFIDIYPFANFDSANYVVRDVIPQAYIWQFYLLYFHIWRAD
jgi:hypothetical protein